MDRRRIAVIAVLCVLAVPMAILTVRSATSGHAATPGSSGSGANGAAGVKVTGAFGDKPTLTVPDTDPPRQLKTEVLTPGSGSTVQSGQTLVANYLGQTWDPKDGQPNVFDNSYDRKVPSGFPIGTGRVIPGWDKALVGQHVGSRLLLTIPPELAYGTDTAAASGASELAGHTLVFVVDIVDSLDPDAAATGAVVAGVPVGLPKVTSEPGKKPAIASVKGVKAGTSPRSALLVKGTGPAIDPAKSLAVQIIQTDTATGKQVQQTWGSGGATILTANQVLRVLPALKGQPVGSRAVAVTPNQSTTPGVILVVDVIAQY
jgi:FKBP-type peptidyl-prolyl cis-trans isomerase 2